MTRQQPLTPPTTRGTLTHNFSGDGPTSFLLRHDCLVLRRATTPPLQEQYGPPPTTLPYLRQIELSPPCGKSSPLTLRSHPPYAPHPHLCLSRLSLNRDSPRPSAHPERSAQNNAAGGTTDPFPLPRLEFSRFSSTDIHIFFSFLTLRCAVRGTRCHKKEGPVSCPVSRVPCVCAATATLRKHGMHVILLHIRVYYLRAPRA